VLHDGGSRVLGEYGADGLPALYLIDRAGAVRARHAGAGSCKAIEGKLTELLGGPAVVEGSLAALPADIRATGLDEADLLGLLLKLIYTGRLQTVRQFADAIKLPYHIVLELVRMAVDRQLLQNLGSRNSDSLIDLAYTFTEEGRRYVQDALSGYFCYGDVA
jgi:hypothetical protein